ncbi:MULTISPECIES: restriction endonuclease subunit S domain-containing protein [Vibrio]|uniref:Restriction endonuclease subunit S n=1 Tax=Vibrio algicola TaxID=2662262 RepID=A0A5Q0TJB4_9VIBR|nr:MULTISPECIES: restriction endonuclease subunit S [Vibrio]MBD1577800.1 restriction endonuclease subunit S [Vibrio sp. S11_S32]
MSNDIEKELADMAAELEESPETPLPSLEEQKAIVAKLKQLEAEGNLTPEALAEHFEQFAEKKGPPVH